MIKEFKCYTLLCDNCGADVNHGNEISGWNDKGYNYEIADCEGWLEHEDKWYCAECYNYDDEDNLIIKEVAK